MTTSDRVGTAAPETVGRARPRRSEGQRAGRFAASHALRSAAWATLASVLALGSARAGDGLSASPPTAQTDKGVVVGTSLGSVQAFLGVPYAAPPVGPLRFRPPRAHAPWSTPVQATQVAQPCPQTRTVPGSAPVITGSEDCLYLNVYTPAKAVSAGRPVMVWIPGGGFVQGSASSPYYNGQYIAEQAGVVVVTVTYRVGALGFLTSPALDRENRAGVSGNYGLLDQQAALRWVQANIASFGGNPKNVTLFGESAGADSTEYALVSPSADGLFQHAIIESSVGLGFIPDLPLATAEATGGAQVVAAVGCANAADVASCLRDLPANAFLTPAATPQGATLPVVDGLVLPQQPLQAFQSGQFSHIPVIIGSTHDEGTFFAFPFDAAPGGLTAAGYAAQVQSIYGTNAGAVLSEYPVSAYPSPIQALAAVFTDADVACPTAEKREALSRYVQVFGYEFSEPNPAQGPLLGPPLPGLTYGDYHTSDLPYVFGVSAPNGARVAGKDLSLSQRIIKYWTSLARAGNPNVPRNQEPYWFNFHVLNGTLLSLQDQITELPEAQFGADHHCRFWNGIQQG